MAIQFNYTTPASGATATYHVVQTLTLDYVGGNTSAQVASYVDAEAKQSGKVPVFVQSIQVAGLPDATSDPSAQIQQSLIAAAPASLPAGVPPNRYTFSGGTLVDMPA